MRTGRAYLAALAELHRVGDVDERRLVWRQGMAALAAVAESDAASLEGFEPAALLAATRTALSDGLVLDLGFLSPAAAAIAIFALASALPPGVERRELGRRVLTRLREGDATTFVALAASLALSSARALAEPPIRARIAAALALPPVTPGLGTLALTLISRPELEHVWLTGPSMGSLPSRRLAARLLECAAREAVRRHAGGDRGAVGAFARPAVRAAWRRLLRDRESLVWRHAAVARGLLAPRDHEQAAAIDSEQRLAASGAGDWRRAGTSLAAAIEVAPAIALPHLLRAIGTLMPREPRRGSARTGTPAEPTAQRAADAAGVAKAMVWGLAGAFAVEPETCDGLIADLVVAGGQDAVEAVADLRRDGAVLPEATAAAIVWLERALPDDRGDDDGRTALLHALRDELTRDTEESLGSLEAPVSAARTALTAGEIATAVRRGRIALDEVAAAVDWLERSGDEDPIERRHAARLLREIDRELLSDGTLGDVLALAGDGGLALRALGGLVARLEQRLVELEAQPEMRSPVPHRTLRLARLRALVRVMDAEVPGEVATRRERRIESVRTLMARAPRDGSPLARGVWAALTRAWDALLRDEHTELSDLLLCLTTSIPPDDDLVVVRQATMVPEVEAMLDSYVSAMQASWRAIDPVDHRAMASAAVQLGRVAEAMPVAASARVEAVRAALGRVARALERLAQVRSQIAVPRDTLDTLEAALGHLADLVVGARRRLGLPARDATASEAAVHAVAVAIDRVQHEGDAPDEAIAAAVDVVTAEHMPVVAVAVSSALARLAALPRTAAIDHDPPLTSDPPLPPWLPLSRTIGGFYVIRPIGTGAGGSVFVACRADERHMIGGGAMTTAGPGRAQTEPPRGLEYVALKVPDYGGAAARNLSEQEFETMFRDEAGALLALPSHPHLARFVTFDAGARPKPILVMELVRGPTLEHVLEVGGLDMAGALAVVDGIAAGLEAMHAAKVAHLDIKPANVILRSGSRVPVLVDFGLAGRTLRPGCGSPYYGAPEVWTANVTTGGPFAADVYAFACLSYEVLTGKTLITGTSLTQILTQHLSGRAGHEARARLAHQPRLAELAEVIHDALNRDPAQRPTVPQLRGHLKAVVGALTDMDWPLDAQDD